MAEETNVPLNEVTDTPALDYAALYAESVTKNTQLDSNYRALQRNLDSRDKSASADVAKLTAEMTRQSELISALVEGSDLLDDDAKEQLRYSQSAAQTARAEAQTKSQLLETVKANLIEAGVQDDDDNYQEINELWVDGDYKEALRASRRLVRDAKKAAVKVEAEPASTNEDLIAAEVDRRLRAHGVRTVDTAQGGVTSGDTVFTKENLKARLASMTPDERRAAHAQIINDIK